MYSLPTFCVNAVLFKLGQSPEQFQVCRYVFCSNLRGLDGFKVCGCHKSQSMEQYCAFLEAYCTSVCGDNAQLCMDEMQNHPALFHFGPSTCTLNEMNN